MTNPIRDADNCIKLQEGFIHLHWTGEDVTETNDAVVWKHLASFNELGRYPLIVELRGVKRDLQIEKLLVAAPLPVTVLALVTSSPIDWATAYFYMSKVSAKCTSKRFATLLEAEAWLQFHTGRS